MNKIYLILLTNIFLLNSALAFEHASKKVLEEKHNDIQVILDRLEGKLGNAQKAVEKEEYGSISEKIKPEAKKEEIKVENNKEKAEAKPEGKAETKNNKIVEDYTGDITFRAKKSSLWLKTSKLAEGKNINDFVEIVLPGELFSPGKEIKETPKEEMNRTTIQGAVSSAFSANKSGDINWIVGNFVEEEQKKARFFFKDKNVLKDSQADAEQIKSKSITGIVNYLGFVIVFVEQDYGDDKKITEAITLKKEGEEYKITNTLTDDETYDVVFAAISNGEVVPGGKISLKE